MGNIAGFSINAETRAALAQFTGAEATDDDVREYMANAVRQLVADYRRGLRDTANPVSTADPLA